MASINKVILVGRCTRDPECRSFANGGKVCKLGFCINNRVKKDGQWGEVPLFLDIDAFNRGEGGKLADLCEQYLHKGSLAHIEGRLELDEWTAQDGQKRSKMKVIADTVQFLDPPPARGQQNTARKPSEELPPPQASEELYPPF